MHDRLRLRLLLAYVMGLSLLVPGCAKKSGSSGPAGRGAAVLGEVTEMISDYVKSHGKPPAKLQDLAQLQQIYPLGFQAVKSGDYVIVYNTKPDKASNSVLAYEKDVAQNGGSVLLANGTIKQMTAAEFEAAKKSSG